jgi:hypothetical protein
VRELLQKFPSLKDDVSPIPPLCSPIELQGNHPRRIGKEGAAALELRVQNLKAEFMHEDLSLSPGDKEKNSSQPKQQLRQQQRKQQPVLSTPSNIATITLSLNRDDQRGKN